MEFLEAPTSSPRTRDGSALRLRRRQDYGLADPHIHSAAGDGLAEIPQLLEHVEHCTSLDVIAITDHDEVSGALVARAMAQERGYSFEVVVGTEISTADGHLLALFVEEAVEPFLSVEESIEMVHRQGGLCVVPHPMSWLTRSIGQMVLERLGSYRDGSVYLDGLETINPTLAGRVSYQKVRRLHRQFKLAETGGSDAHFLAAIGAAYTLFPGHTAADLRRAIEGRTSRAGGGLQVKLSTIGLGQLLRQTGRGLVVHPLRLFYRTLRTVLRTGLP